MVRRICSLALIGTMLAVTAIVPVSASDTAWTVDKDLVGHWDLDEGTTVEVSDDYKENICNGDANCWGCSKYYSEDDKKKTTDADGMIGKAFSQTNYSYIATDTVPQSELDENKEMTIAMWVKSPNPVQTNESVSTFVFGMGAQNSSNGIKYNLICDMIKGLTWQIPAWKSPGEGAKGGYGEYTAKDLRMIEPNEVDTDTWYHVALKLKFGVERHNESKPDDKAKALVTYECYLNGQKLDACCGEIDWQVTEVKSFFHNASSEGTDNYIATINAGVAYGGAANANFKGCIDDVRVYNKADDVDVAKIYNLPTTTALLGHWKLDDVNAGSYAKHANTAVYAESTGTTVWGESKLKQVATVDYGYSVKDAIGMDGKAFKQDGYSYIQTASVPRTELDANKQMTIAMWVKAPDAQTVHDRLWVFGMGAENSSNQVKYALSCDQTNGIVWHIPKKDGSGGGYGTAKDMEITVVAADGIENNKWYHVALKLEYGKLRADDQAALTAYECYVDGQKVETACGTVNWEAVMKSFFYDATSGSTDNYVMTIGANVNDASSNFKGSIDDVRVYNKTSIIDIADIYNSTKNHEAVKFEVSKVNKNDPGAVTAVVVKNTSAAKIDGKLIAAVYDSATGVLKGAEVGAISAESDEYTTVTFANPLAKAAGQTLKVFVWKDLSNLEPTSFTLYSE